jgi:hypothetical protein
MACEEVRLLRDQTDDRRAGLGPFLRFAHVETVKPLVQVIRRELVHCPCPPQSDIARTWRCISEAMQGPFCVYGHCSMGPSSPSSEIFMAPRALCLGYQCKRRASPARKRQGRMSSLLYIAGRAGLDMSRFTIITTSRQARPSMLKACAPARQARRSPAAAPCQPQRKAGARRKAAGRNATSLGPWAWV